MSEIIVYHNNRCSKSRDAISILEEKGIPYKVRYYLQDPPSEQELKTLLRKAGLKAIDIVRKSETLYKEEYKDKDLSEAEWLKVLAANPILIERPIVINGDKAVVARPPEKVLEIL